MLLLGWAAGQVAALQAEETQQQTERDKTHCDIHAILACNTSTSCIHMWFRLYQKLYQAFLASEGLSTK
jgi:hypothetical protein